MLSVKVTYNTRSQLTTKAATPEADPTNAINDSNTLATELRTIKKTWCKERHNIILVNTVINFLIWPWCLAKSNVQILCITWMLKMKPSEIAGLIYFGRRGDMSACWMFDILGQCHNGVDWRANFMCQTRYSSNRITISNSRFTQWRQSVSHQIICRSFSG